MTVEVPTSAAPARAYAPASTFARALSLLSDGICGLAGAGVLVVVLAQVVSRLAGAPAPWSEELTRALFIWMVFFGLAASMRHADAARVTVFLEYAPPAVRRLALPVYVATSLAFFGLMGWTGYGMVRQQFVMNEHVATLGWPTWLIGLVMPVCAVIAAVCTLQSLREHRAAIALLPASGERPEGAR
jgi:C4-dicarboxylate transporter, DctQ subunit